MVPALSEAVANVSPWEYFIYEHNSRRAVVQPTEQLPGRLCLKNKYGLTGRGVSVAVLDTGITPHIDFDRRILVFLDLISGHVHPYDDNGHGSHVAGLIGGSGKASGGKYEGVAPECNFVVLKILDHKGNGRKQDVLKAIDWVRRMRMKYNIRILNISIGTTEQEKVLHDLLIEAVEEA